jgi:nucleoside-diphosphate-sugar epimerase
VRYVVTGAAGFIGSHLADSLLAAGHDVLAVDCFADYYDVARKEANAAGLDVVRVDLAEAPVDELVAGTDGVFHLAGQPGVRASWGERFALYARRNLVATHRVFEAAARAGVRVVFSSSSSVYGDAERYPTREEDEPAPISGSATVLGDVVWFSTLKRRTYALDARTGRELWSFPDGKYSGVVADARRVYLVGYTRVYGMVAKR